LRGCVVGGGGGGLGARIGARDGREQGARGIAAVLQGISDHRYCLGRLRLYRDKTIVVAEPLSHQRITMSHANFALRPPRKIAGDPLALSCAHGYGLPEGSGSCVLASPGSDQRLMGDLSKSLHHPTGFTYWMPIQ